MCIRDSATAVETVKSVQPIRLDEPVAVYDLEVEDTHNFAIGDGRHRSIIVHNSEYMYLDDSACFAPETRISTPDGLRSVEELFLQQERGEPVLVTTDISSEQDHRRMSVHRPVLVTRVGRRPVMRMRLKDGRVIRTTADHRFLTHTGAWKRVDELAVGVDRVAIREAGNTVSFASPATDVKRWQMLGWLTGDGVFSKDTVALVFGPREHRTAMIMTEELNRLKVAAGAEGAMARTSSISVQGNGVMQTSASQVSLIRMLETHYGFRQGTAITKDCLLYTSPSPRDLSSSRMPSSA